MYVVAALGPEGRWKWEAPVQDCYWNLKEIKDTIRGNRMDHEKAVGEDLKRRKWYWKLEERGLLCSDGKFSNNVSCSKVENKKYTYFWAKKTYRKDWKCVASYLLLASCSKM